MDSPGLDPASLAPSGRLLGAWLAGVLGLSVAGSPGWPTGRRTGRDGSSLLALAGAAFVAGFLGLRRVLGG